jgi:hypothetical protein
MPIITTNRTATTDEIAAEMDRRGRVIEALEAENERLREALKEIEAFGPGITHGRAVGVRSIARAALNKEGG